MGLGAAGLAGCTSVPKEAGFPDVQQTIADRAGHLVQWRGNSAADDAVDAAVAALLHRELTVEAAVQVALLNNRHLQATYEDLGIAQADLVQAGLLKNPVFAGSWRFPDRSPGGTNAEYSVTQDFLNLLIIPLRKTMAKRQFESTKRSVAHAVLQLAAEVKTAYYTLQAREQLLKRLRLMMDINQTAAELAQRQQEAGTLNELGLISQRAVYHQSRVDVAQAEAQLAADRERLNRLLGLWGDQTGWTVADHLPDIPAKEIPVEHLESLAIRQRLDLAATRDQLVALGQALGLTERYGSFASVEVGVDTEREPDGQWLTGPTLSLQLPIFDQGQARVARARGQFRQLQRRFEAMAIDIRSEVRGARDRLLAERNLAEYYKALLPERMRILQLTLLQYNGMLKGPYDLLAARQGEVATEQAYIEAWRDYWLARVELERAVGGRLGGERQPGTDTARINPDKAGAKP
jgi:cobalt-zinc-cadmium efflux system outer membrane protein